MKLAGRLFVFAAALSFAALPAEAKDRDHHHNSDHRYDRHDYRGSYYGGRPRVGFGIGIVPQPYYYRAPSTVIIERERPVYYSESRAYSQEDPGVEVQRALVRRGYYRGPIDGDIGPGSRAAIRNFQADRGLPVTGHIDRRLLDSLR